jgi:cobalt-zinc-cadmium efflux system outer membrane protein
MKHKQPVPDNLIVQILLVSSLIGSTAPALAASTGPGGAPTLDATQPANPPSPQTAPAQLTASRTLSLEAAFNQAVDANKELIAAKYNLPVGEAAIRMARAFPNPRFSILYGLGPAFTVILAGNPQQFGLQQQIQTAGKRGKQVQLARANYHVTEFQVAALLFDVHNRVRRAYAEQAAAEAYAALIESQRTVAVQLQSIASKRYESGKAAKSEVLQADLGVLQFDTQRNQALMRLQQATAGLSQIIGEVPAHLDVIDVDDNGIFKLSAIKTDLVPPPERELPSLDALLPVAYKQRPDLQQQIEQTFADRKALTVARAARIPNLFVDSGYQFTTFKRTQPYGIYNGIVHNQPGCYVNVAAELPLFYQHQGETDQAKDTWLQDFDQLAQLRSQIATDIVTSYESVVVSRANIAKFQKELIPAAAKVAALARRGYEVGKTDLATAILAKQQYQQMLSAYFDAVVSYQIAWADLEKAMGVPLKL